MAIPLFILAGELMAAGGVSKRILNVCSAYFGHITGGLAIGTGGGWIFFAAVSGSGPATVAAVGAMVVPAMLEKMPSLKAMYSADDDNTQVLYFKNATATFSSFTSAPETISF